MAALSWHVGVQQFCHHALETQFYGPLVPHVCQNVRLHQQCHQSHLVHGNVHQISSSFSAHSTLRTQLTQSAEITWNSNASFRSLGLKEEEEIQANVCLMFMVDASPRFLLICLDRSGHMTSFSP
ncbi:Uncharacterized protein APZ42_030764 [Daphnia magna]|uniref:Uncharacterized protein n=1 Tax=Daphnia magna TaxID=35525 RepID=A0A164NB28_9CRUS|nr:Uncharacterized protein APZ42_030764 [Daphnia magna]